MQKLSNKLSKVFSFILIFILTISFSPLNTEASAGDFIWAKSMGSTGFDKGNSISTDSSGNVYTTGYFHGTVDFDPGVVTLNLTSNGSRDIYVSKSNSSGDLIWAKSMGGSEEDEARSVFVDSVGNVYTTGYFRDTVDFDPGAGTFNLTSAGEDDPFVSKLNSNGDFLWAKSFGGVDIDMGIYISVDSSGNVYTAGHFDITADFDPGVGTFNLNSVNGSSDVFISKLNSNGDFVWVKQIGGFNSDFPFSMLLDSSGNIYTTGYFSNSNADFDPGAGTFNLTNAGGADVFISKLNSNGDFLWAKGMGGASSDQGSSVSVDSSGNVYTTGYFSLTVDFDPGAGTSNLTSLGGNDIFISKFDSSGNFIWAKSMGGASSDQGSSVSVDSSGNVYTTGYFNGTVDFDPGIGVSNLTSLGSNDVFISKLNSNGDFIWGKQVGSTGADESNSIFLDSSSNVYTTGSFNGTVDFDPGAGTSNLISTGFTDIFILKLGTLLPVLTEVTPIGPVLVNQNTPSYTFSSTQAGTITYGGACSSATTTAVVGNNTIVLNSLPPGYYNNCTITVTNVTSQASAPLAASPFSLVVHSGGSGVPTPTVPTPPTPTPVQTPITPVTPTPTVTTPTPTKPLISYPVSSKPGITYISPINKKEKLCPGFDTYLIKGSKGEKVKELQAFLNTVFNINLSVDGAFGSNTEKKVKEYQTIHKDTILTPWGLTQATGRWYKSSRFAANNDIGCSEIEVKLDNGVVVKY